MEDTKTSLHKLLINAKEPNMNRGETALLNPSVLNALSRLKETILETRVDGKHLGIEAIQYCTVEEHLAIHTDYNDLQVCISISDFQAMHNGFVYFCIQDENQLRHFRTFLDYQKWLEGYKEAKVLEAVYYLENNG